MSRMLLLTLLGLSLVAAGCQGHKHKMPAQPQAVTTAKAPAKPAPAPAPAAAPARPAAPAPAPVTTKAAASAPAAVPAAGWKVAYTANLKDAAAVNDFEKLDATLKVEEGAWIVKPDQVHQAQVLLKKSFPGSVRVELAGSLSGETLSDLSVLLNSGGDGYASAYLLQLGGKTNTLSRLLKNGEEVEGTQGKFVVTPGKTYQVVAENDNGKVTLTVDGKVIFTHTDASPLKGADHDKIGFYTYNDTMKINSLVVSTK